MTSDKITGCSETVVWCCEPDRCVYNTLPSRFHTLQGARSHLTSLASTPTHMWTHIQTTSSPCFCLNQQQPYPDCPCQLFKVKCKGIVYPKIKKCTHPQATQYVDEIVSSSEHICSNLALRYMLTNGSSAVNGCQTADIHHNNLQVIHSTPVHQFTCEAACLQETIPL